MQVAGSDEEQPEVRDKRAAGSVVVVGVCGTLAVRWTSWTERESVRERVVAGRGESLLLETSSTHSSSPLLAGTAVDKLIATLIALARA